MKKYEKYKSVDLIWLNEVPEHWEIKKIGSLFTERREKVSDKVFLPLSVTKKGILPQMENVAKSDNGDNRKKVCAGDFVINSRSDRKGSSGISFLDGSVSLINIVLVPRNINKYYINYLLRSIDFQEEFYRNGTGIVDDLWTTRYQNMKNIYLCIPPFEEQKQIANYLDWKINEIDKLIEIEKQKIKRINNYIISLHDKLILNNDENIKSWIIRNDIYEYKNDIVKIKKLKNILKKIEKDADENKEVIICSNSGKSVLKGERKIGLYSDDIKMYQNIDKGQLMIHGMDTWHGAICISEYDGRCTRVVHVCDTKEDKLYIYYYLRLLSFLKLYKPFSNGVRQNTSDFRSWGNLGQINIVLPQFNDQVRISNKLYTLISNSEKVIALIKKEIEQLYELKNSIISEVVTGKIDVRDVVIPKYEKLNINEVIKEDSFEKGIENDDE